MNEIMPRNWVVEAEMFFQQRYEQLSGERSALKISPCLDESEAQFFLMGMEDGMFFVDDQSYVQTKVLAPPSGKNRKQKMVQLFWTRQNRKYLFREGVCQLSTVASLILKYGWSRGEIVMEPGIREFGRFAYAIDIVVRDSQGGMICVEVKRSEMELQKLVDGFINCCKIGPHTYNQCPFKKNHRKYDFCAELKPLYFVATSPGREVSFKLVHNGHITIEKRCEGLIYKDGLLLSAARP